MKRIIALMITGLGCAFLCIAQTQPVTNGYRQEGIASYYGDEYDGLNTASGEKYDSTKFTAAHPTLPFGTILTVTNTQNNKQVIVRVNDRGPSKPVRIIDVSKAAAEQLDMLITGTAPVIIEEKIPSSTVTFLPSPTSPGILQSQTIPPGPQNTPSENLAPPPYVPTRSGYIAAEIKPSIPPPGTGKRYRIQVGAYKIVRNAMDVFDKLKNTGLNPAYERNGDYYRVVLAGINADDVQLVAEKLGSAGFREALIREEPTVSNE
ncbi:MAG: septal ring lytic transglycosylase RlpA family protein [Treponema sp.]|jgi:rare lipoprotein A|nr:septal ring lytic transglycosylase RlpA family protein [Treponema sp.]